MGQKKKNTQNKKTKLKQVSEVPMDKEKKINKAGIQGPDGP